MATEKYGHCVVFIKVFNSSTMQENRGQLRISKAFNKKTKKNILLRAICF